MAVKDASKEQVEGKNTAIGKLLERKVRSELKIAELLASIRSKALGEYREILTANSEKLGVLSKSLTEKFQIWAHEDASLRVQWQEIDKAVAVIDPTAEIKAIEGVFQGDIARFGHGLQRSIIFTLLEELSEHSDSGPCLVLGCEEPELYQHPPQARHLASVLRKLSANNAQVLVCTHSPYFVSGRNFENIRMFSKDVGEGYVSAKSANAATVSKIIEEATGRAPIKPGESLAKIEQEMETSLNEMFFASLRIFLEGQEDVAYISSYLTLLDKWDEFRSLGGHLIRADGKSHLIEALAISNALALPSFVVFDADGDTEDKDGRRKQQEDENKALFKLMSLESLDPFPKSAIFEKNLIVWPENIGKMFEEEIGLKNLQKIKEEVRAKFGFNSNMDKNPLFVGYVVGESWNQGFRSASLQKVCDNIIAYAKSLIKKPEVDAKESAVS